MGAGKVVLATGDRVRHDVIDELVCPHQQAWDHQRNSWLLGLLLGWLLQAV